MSSPEDKHRLFVALWPSPSFAGELSALSAKAVGDGRPVSTDRLHVTLQFLGEVAAPRLADITPALDRVSSPAFELVLNRFGYWHRTRVVWLGTSHRCEPLLELASGVAIELRSIGFKRERRSFRGHLTIARNCRRPGDLRPPQPLRWEVREFSLVASTLTPRGALYRPLHTCRLAPET